MARCGMERLDESEGEGRQTKEKVKREGGENDDNKYQLCAYFIAKKLVGRVR